MSASGEQDPLHVALVGNPNTGKSTLFSALAGIHQRVGNYPGVTVERKTGHMLHAGRNFELIDLPGTYSLAPRSMDEQVAVDVLLGRRSETRPPDAVICIVDASNLQRHLYLVSQILEMGLPTVLALNMLDVADDRGISIDVQRLQERLGIPVIPMQAHRGRGVPEVREAIVSVIGRPAAVHDSPMPEIFEHEVTHLESFLDRTRPDRGDPLPRCLVRRLLLDSGAYLEEALFVEGDDRLSRELRAARARLEKAGCGVPGVETQARYDWLHRVLEGAVSTPEGYRTNFTDRLDRVLTHRLWGTLVFLGVMLVVFQSVFVWAVPFIDVIDGGVATVASWIESWMVAGTPRSLLVDGVIAGVGGVLVFLPQILILFLFIAVLEDCGYMARAAYLMDRLMVRVGLSGKSFIPMLSSFACAVPGVMAARVIESRRDRLTTILVAPLMTCSARLPIYALLIGAFIPPTKVLGGILTLQGLTLTALYLLGIVTAILVALILKRTLLFGVTPPFVIELPSYKRPSIRTVLFRVVERAWVFLRCAGTMILAVSILVWAALYFPRNAAVVEAPFQAEMRQIEADLSTLAPGDSRYEQLVAQRAQLNREIAGAYQRQSYLGRVGRFLEPVFRPLGWDWRIGSAVIASFPAREVVVATMGVVYNLGEDADTESEEGVTQFRSRLEQATWDGTNRKVFSVPVSLSIMVFFALCCQCVATLAVIRRETNSWRWPLFTFVYMTTLAYAGAFVTYQIASRF